MGGVCGIGSIKGRLSPIGSLQGALSIPVGGGLDCDIYEGEYNITPSDTVQVLPTANKLLKHDIVIEASSGGLPEGSEMATDDDIDGLIDDIFGTGVNPDPVVLRRTSLKRSKSMALRQPLRLRISLLL